MHAPWRGWCGLGLVAQPRRPPVCNGFPKTALPRPANHRAKRNSMTVNVNPRLPRLSVAEANEDEWLWLIG